MCRRLIYGCDGLPKICVLQKETKRKRKKRKKKKQKKKGEKEKKDGWVENLAPVMKPSDVHLLSVHPSRSLLNHSRVFCMFVCLFCGGVVVVG